MKEKNELCSYVAPLTNRGVIPTLRDGSIMLFDWVQATIFPFSKYKDIYSLFFHLFGINRNQVLYDKVSSLFGYNHSYSYRHLYIFVSDDRDDMGVHIYLTGQGCRDLEDLGITYYDLFFKLFEFNCQFTRIDVSIDDFTGELFTLDRVVKCIKNHEVITRFRSSIQFVKEDLDSLKNIGHTVWFGSRSSDVQFVFYDKLKERVYNADVEVNDNIKFWNRLEMRFRNDNATNIAFNYLWCNDFNFYILGLINNYLSFRQKSKTDSNRHRWKMKKWWYDFLGDVPKIKFQNYPLEYSITRKKSWLDRSCSYSAFSVLLSDIKDLSCDTMLSRYLYDFFIKGSKNINEKDLQYINQYRIVNNLVPITIEDVKSFVQDIKEFIIKK